MAADPGMVPGRQNRNVLVSKGGSSEASVQATLCQPVHGTSFELNSLASRVCLDKKSQKTMVFFE